MPDSDAAVSDMRAASRFPIVVPQLMSVACVECPHVIGRCDIQNVIDGKNCPLDRDSSRSVFLEAFSAHDRAATGCGVQPQHPPQCETLHRIAIGLFQSAVTPARI